MDNPSGEGSMIPDFAISLYADSEGLTLETHTPQNPDIRKYANQGLLYGLAILVLDKQGVIERMVEELEMAGPINEVDAVNRIALLVEASNVSPA